MKSKKNRKNGLDSILFSLAFIPLLFAFAANFRAVDISPSPALRGDLPPSISLSASALEVETTVVLTALAIDYGDNAGIDWIKIYQDGSLLDTKNCQGLSSCTFVKTVVETQHISHSYYARAKDKGGHIVQSATIIVHFKGLNHPPQINSFVPTDTTPELNADEVLHFEVWASDPDGDELSYVWTVDGAQVATSAGWDYAPTINDIGSHQVVVSVSDGEHEVTQAWDVTVLKAISSCSLNFIPPSPISYNQQPFIANCSCTNPEANAQLWRNGQDVTSENNQPVTLAANPSGYGYVCNVSETQHYRGASNSSIYVINKASTILNLTSTPSWSVVYGTQTNVSCSANNAEVSLALYRNSVLVNNPDVQTLAAGIYNYVCNACESQNWTASAATNILNVSKAASQVNLLLNGVDGNITVAINEQVEINGALIVPSSSPGPSPIPDNVIAAKKQIALNNVMPINSENAVPVNSRQINQPQEQSHKQYTIELWLDNVLVASGERNVSYATSFVAPGSHNVTLVYPETQNYSSSFETHWIEVVTDTEAPVIEFIAPTPANGTIITQDWIFINTSITDNVAVDSAILEWNGVNESMQGSGTNYYLNKTALVDGTYIFRVYANDTSNNWNVSETRTVTIALPAHDIAILSLILLKEVAGINVSIEASTAYLNDSIFALALVKNVGTFNESVNISLQNNIGIIDSKIVSIEAGQTELVSFSWQIAPDGWHTLRVKAEPVPGETNFANNELSQDVRVWKACDVIDCSIFGPRTAQDSYPLGQPFRVKALMQNAWNNETFKDLKIELVVDPALQIIDPWPAVQWFDLDPSQFAVANWNVTSINTGNYSITAWAGNREYSATKYVEII